MVFGLFVEAPYRLNEMSFTTNVGRCWKHGVMDVSTWLLEVLTREGANQQSQELILSSWHRLPCGICASECVGHVVIAGRIRTFETDPET